MDPQAPGSGSERWSALEIRLLVAFVAVVDAGSFTGAARELGYTQSGVSQQIAALERIVDRKLLVRQSGGRRPIELTPAGEALLRHSRILLGQLDRAYAEMIGAEEEVATTVALISFPSAAVHLIPTIERKLRDTPLRLDLHETLSDEDSLVALESRQVELALLSLPVPGQFAVEELGDDPYVAAVSAGSPLARHRTLEVEHLAGQPLIGLRQSPHEELVEARLAAAGVDTRQFRRYDNNRLIQAMVRAGEGVAIVPSLTIFGNDDAVRVLRLRVDLPPRVIALAHLREALLSPAARQFKQLAMPVWRHILDGTPHAWERAAS